MNAETLVNAVIESVLDKNTSFYRETLTHSEGATDPYWIAALAFYSSLSERQQDVVIRMMQQAVIDTISNIFGVLDGSSALPGMPERFRLTYGSSPEKLNGDLQDLFIGEMEERGL